MNPIVRLAEPRDCQAIMAIETATFELDAWSEEIMAAELASPHTVYLVACDGDEVVAYGGLCSPHASDQADIQTLAVASAWRRHGLGRTLLRRLIKEARERSVTAVFLEVRADNPEAQALYRSEEFHDVDIRRGYYQPGNVDALIMRLALDKQGAARESTVREGTIDGE